MHVAVSIVVVGVMYVGLFHTSVNRWVVIVGTLVAASFAHAFASGTQGTVGLVAEYVILFLVVAVGLAKRNVDAIAEDLEDLSTDPAMVRADGVAVADHLEGAGFERSPEGWLHFERHGWDALALRDGPVNAFVVSGERGPLVEFTTVLDDDHVVMTVSRARHQVVPRILRQTFPDHDVDGLRREHDRALGWSRRMARTPVEVPLGELTERMLTEEREAGSRARKSVAGSLVRELRGQHLDSGTIVDRPDAVRALQPRR